MQPIEFLDFLFKGEKGLVYAPYKNKDSFTKNWYRWPEDREWMVCDFERVKDNNDVFISPVLYNSEDTKDFKSSRVVWCDFDDGIPAELGDFPRPSIQISSSGNTRKQHWYWSLSEHCTDSSRLETWNKLLAYALGADKGCWNFSRILRPPSTLNHKYNPPAPVSYLGASQTVLEGSLLDLLPKPLGGLSEPSRGTQELFSWKVVEIEPSWKEKYPNDKFWEFYWKNDHIDRSNALSSVALSCTEMGMSRDEIMMILYAADNRWGKFVGRSDREHRLQSILLYAESQNRKEPSVLNTSNEQLSGPVPFSKFVGFNYNIDWVINGLLHSQGLAVLASPPGVGKTQFSTNLMLSVGCGKSFLDWSITRPRRTLFLSLEMTQPELKYYLDKMSAVLTEEEKELVDANCFFVSRQAFRLNSSNNQEILLRWIDEIQPEGIFIDSLSRCVGGDLEKGEIDAVFDFLNKEVRDKRGCFIWFVHHNRKANFNQKQPKKLEDLYGSQYIGAYASSVIGLWKIDDRELEVNSLKVWFSKPFQTFRIERTDNLTFIKRVEKHHWT